MSLSEGAYNNLNVHAQVYADGEDQTAAVDGRAIELVIDCGGTTAVELIYFTATAYNGEVLLEWKTATEIDNAGFNIYRSKRIGGSYTRINEELIDAGGDAVSGATYSYLDFPDSSGRYFYTLEDIDTNGKNNMHGTMKVWVKVSE